MNIKIDFIFYSVGQVPFSHELRRHVDFLLFIFTIHRIHKKINKIWEGFTKSIMACAESIDKFRIIFMKAIQEESREDRHGE
jgi:hypothetical protein